MTEKYKDAISAERIRAIELMLKDNKTASRLTAVIAGDGSLRRMLLEFLGGDRSHRARAFHLLLPAMRTNGVPEDLIWVLAGAANHDAIAKAMLRLIEEAN